MLRPNQNQLPGSDALQAVQPHALSVSGAAAPDAGLFHVIWRRRWIVLFAMVLAISAALVHIHQAIPIYDSTSRLVVEKSGPQIMNNSGEMSMMGGINYLLTQCELLRSAPILTLALGDQEVAGMKSFRGVDNPVGWLKSNTEATVGKNSDIISVTVQSPNRYEAARLVNAVVNAYVIYSGGQKQTTAKQVLEILTRERTKRDADYNAKLQAITGFRQQYGFVGLDAGEHGGVVSEKLSKISDALTASQIELIECKTQYDTINSMMNEPGKLKQLILEAQVGHEAGLPQMSLTNGGENAIRGALQQQQEVLDELTRTYLPNHPQVRATRDRIDRLTARLQVTAGAEDKEFADVYLGVIQRRFERVKQREGELVKIYTEQEKLALNANAITNQYMLLKEDLQRTETQVAMLDNRIKELSVTEGVGALNITVLEVGHPSDSPVKPDKPSELLKALLGGLVAGLGLAFLRDWLDQRIRTAEEVTSTLGLPVLGIVPKMLGKQIPAACGRKVFLAPQSNIAEAYRTIRTAIYFGMPDPESKTLLFTSPAPGDGKTTSACNLAIAMAQAGQRTLIIDCDFRRPSVHKVFLLDNEAGMSNVFTGRDPVENVIVPSGVDHLDVLPCGPLPTNPSEILNSRPFAELISKLAARYDHIVIDSPPIIPVTDARILAGMCDMTVLVVRAEKSTRKSIRLARDILVGVRARLLGTIVNDLTGKKDSYYYGYYQKGRPVPGALEVPDRGGLEGDKITAVAVARSSRQ